MDYRVVFDGCLYKVQSRNFIGWKDIKEFTLKDLAIDYARELYIPPITPSNVKVVWTIEDDRPMEYY